MGFERVILPRLAGHESFLVRASTDATVSTAVIAESKKLFFLLELGLERVAVGEGLGEEGFGVGAEAGVGVGQGFGVGFGKSWG